MDIRKEREAFESVFTEAKGWDLTFIMGCYQNIETLRAFAGWLAAKAQAVPEWISVEDGLPSDGQNIIAFDAIKHCVFKDGEFLQGYFEPDTGHEYTEPVDVTHWIAIEAQEPTND